MRKSSSFLFLTALLMLCLLAIPSYAHEGGHHKKGKHGGKVQHALGELKDAKAAIEKITPDTDGHVAKAKEAVDQAISELTAMPKPEHKEHKKDKDDKEDKEEAPKS